MSLATALQAKNLERMQNLEREGFVLDGTVLLKMRLDQLTEHVLGDDQEAIEQFGLTWEKRLDEILGEIESQINRAKLLRGGTQLSINDALRGS